MTFSEDSRVKIPSILHLARLGYDYLSKDDAVWDESTNIFPDIFQENLLRINPDAGLGEGLVETSGKGLVETRVQTRVQKQVESSVKGLAGDKGSTTQETTQEKVLAILRKQPGATRNELADRIGITPDGIKYHLTKLRASGVIRHIGPTKAGHWEILEEQP